MIGVQKVQHQLQGLVIVHVRPGGTGVKEHVSLVSVVHQVQQEPINVFHVPRSQEHSKKELAAVQKERSGPGVRQDLPVLAALARKTPTNLKIWILVLAVRTILPPHMDQFIAFVQ